MDLATQLANDLTIGHHGFTFFGPLVLEFAPLNLSFMVDRVQTVLQRSKLRSCNTLLDEQSNPWNLLQLQVVLIQHRGPKPFC